MRGGGVVSPHSYQWVQKYSATLALIQQKRNLKSGRRHFIWTSATFIQRRRESFLSINIIYMNCYFVEFELKFLKSILFCHVLERTTTMHQFIIIYTYSQFQSSLAMARVHWKMNKELGNPFEKINREMVVRGSAFLWPEGKCRSCATSWLFQYCY